MAKDIDSELAANIKQAKNKRMYFAFVAKGSSDGALVVSKTKVPPVLIADAKKTSGGTQVFKGACFGEDGKLIFEMAKEPPATMEAALKKVVHRDAGLSQHCVCRTGSNPDLADDAAASDDAPTAATTPAAKPAPTEASPAATTAESASTTAAKPGEFYARYVQLQDAIQPQLLQALKDKVGDSEKMKTVFNYARGQAAKKDYAKAIQGLGALDGLLKSGYAAYAAVFPASGSGVAAPAASDPLRGAASGWAYSADDAAVVPPTDEARARAALKPDRIDSEWARGIDLEKCKVKFSADAPHGEFGKLGFIESSDPGAPPLVIKVPLKEAGAADLQKEVDFYKQVGEHPNFAKCLGIADVDGQRGMVMEGIKGKDMNKAMDKLKEQYKSGKVSHEEYWGAVQHTMRQTLEAIAHLESVGVVHNDIRMENIMCDEATGQMKVLDFGVSVNAGQAAEKLPIGHGTVSPDVIQRDASGKPISSRAPVTAKHDVFSVGAATFAAGEKQVFDYGANTGSLGTFAGLINFGNVDDEGTSKKAISPADAQNPAFVKDAAGNAQHVVGRSGASSEYTKFINRLMDPDPNKRLKPADALKEPFLADSLLGEDAAREVFKKLLAPPAKGSTPAPAASAPGPGADAPKPPDDPLRGEQPNPAAYGQYRGAS